MMRGLSIFLAVMSLPVSTAAAVAHEDHCAAAAASVEDAGFSDSVTVTCTDTHAVVSSDTYPDHEMMTGIVGTNAQVPVPADYAAPILLEPVLGETPLSRDAALGVAINGVPIYDYTAGGEMSQADLAHHQAQHDTFQTQQLDICGGHAGRGDDYHYHMAPVCMIAEMENAGPGAIIGWAFDGYPIYGLLNPDGTEIPEGAPDVCNGQPDDTFGYRYHTSEEAPYIVQCLMGEVADFDRLPRVRPLRAQGGGGAEPGRPPRGGVENMVLTQLEDGSRSMDYSYSGEDNIISNTPADTEACYSFTARTVTDGGEVREMELCR